MLCLPIVSRRKNKKSDKALLVSSSAQSSAPSSTSTSKSSSFVSSCFGLDVHNQVLIAMGPPITEWLPDEVLSQIADFLNPADKWRLSVTNSVFRHIVPIPLRIKLVSRETKSTLGNKFYVSPADQPNKTLLNDEVLRVGVEYLFWTYDYERQNKVFLGRHGTKLLETGGELFTMGLRALEPNQTWKIYKDGKQDGDVVDFDTPLGLTVAGTYADHRKHRRPDSDIRLFMSAYEFERRILWFSVEDKWGPEERIHILRCSECYSSRNKKTEMKKLSSLREQSLIIHAVPDIMDGGCYMFSPESLQHGSARCELYHANVSFHYWIEDGMMMFRAFQFLSFTFAVPILEEDNVVEYDPLSPLKVLIKKNSSRWWAIKHYMCVAADVSEGEKFQMENFLVTSKDHEDHTVVFDSKRDLVYITVQDSVIDKSFPNVERNGKVWTLLLCG